MLSSGFRTGGPRPGKLEARRRHGRWLRSQRFGVSSSAMNHPAGGNYAKQLHEDRCFEKRADDLLSANRRKKPSEWSDKKGEASP